MEPVVVVVPAMVVVPAVMLDLRIKISEDGPFLSSFNACCSIARSPKIVLGNCVIPPGCLLGAIGMLQCSIPAVARVSIFFRKHRSAL
jgi:hypothetical protein